MKLKWQKYIYEVPVLRGGVGGILAIFDGVIGHKELASEDSNIVNFSASISA